MSGTAIEPIVSRDLERVAAIHGACFDDAWSEDMIRRVLATTGAFGLVARSSASRSIVAFALSRVVVDECELLSLGVAPDRQRQGIGGALLDAAMARAAALRVRRFFLEVGEFNAPARRLYESRGLKIVGRRADYYALEGGGAMDALTMRCEPVSVVNRTAVGGGSRISPSQAMSSRS